MPPTDVTYPPLETPKPVAEGLWIVDSGPLHLLGLRLPVRMTVLRLPDGGLWLHSPTAHSPALQAALEALGPIRHLVAPNTVHWTYLAAWQRHCPGALLWGAPGLAQRRAVRREGLRWDGVLGEAPPPHWDGVLEQVVVPGGFGFHEVGFLHRATRSLILTDLVQAFEAAKLPAVQRPVVRFLGAMAPDAGTPLQLRAVLAIRRGAVAEAAQRMLGWAPERVIFAHGTWFATDGTARLRAALGWLAG